MFTITIQVSAGGDCTEVVFKGVFCHSEAEAWGWANGAMYQLGLYALKIDVKRVK